MKRADVENRRLTLEAKQIELAVSHRNVDGIAVQRVGDSMYQVILAKDGDLSLRALTHTAACAGRFRRH